MTEVQTLFDRSPAAGCRRAQSAFTLVELLVVIAIIGILAALTIGVAGHAIRAKRLNRVRAELAQLVTSLDSYHSRLNSYPPCTNSLVNPLYYELVGTVYDPNNATFRLVEEPATTANITGPQCFNSTAIGLMFGQPGFLNAQEDTNQVKPFLVLRTGDQKREYVARSIHAFLLAVPAQGSSTNEKSVQGGTATFNPWQYVSPGTNNPKSYDLWAEVKVGTDGNGQDIIQIIGNWNGVK